MDYSCGKFGDCNFSRFGFIVQTDRQTESHTDAAKRFTPATVVGVSNNCIYAAIVFGTALRNW